MRCRVHGSKVVRWTTHDGQVVEASVTVAERMRVRVCDARKVTGDDDNATDALAAFREGCKIVCRCMNEEGCSPEDCDALYVFDAAGEHIATMHGHWKAEVLDNGNIGVCRKPAATGDAAIDDAGDRCAEMIRQRLAALNEANRIFWAARNGEEEPAGRARTTDESPHVALNRRNAEFWK